MPNVELIAGTLGSMQTIDGERFIASHRGEIGVLVYGPYDPVEAGHYRASFRLGLVDVEAPIGNSICAMIEVMTGRGASVLTQRRILYSELSAELKEFHLDFFLHDARVVEYRVHTTGQSSLRVRADVELASYRPAPRARPSRGSKQREWENEREFLDGYLRNVDGVIHVGANVGQERRYYWLIGVDVLWVEPIREIYERLVDNIGQYNRQRALFALLGASDGEEVTLGIANNNGASSSILPLEDHKVLFPGIDYIEQRRMTTSKLSTLLEREHVDIGSYQALTIDAEGAELLILRGAEGILRHFEYIKCEVADFPARTGTPTTSQLDALLREHGFRELARRPFGMGPDNAGTYWDIVWKREKTGEALHEPGVYLPLVMDQAEVEGIEKCE